MKKKTDYETEKEIKKQQFVNNEFLCLKELSGKYDDPYAKDYLEKCPVCGELCAVDQYGNGDCRNCSWKLNSFAESIPDRVQYPNMVSLNKAKQLYKNGKSLKPSFDYFIAGLEMYGETSFFYKNIEAVLFFKQVNELHMEYGEKTYIFDGVKDFRENANIDGHLLKDIWDKIEKADYLQG